MNQKALGSGPLPDATAASGIDLRALSSSDSDSRFRLLVESVVDYGIFMLDAQGRITSWNVGAERIYGYRAHEILGQHFSVFYPRQEIAAGRCDRDLKVAAEQGRLEDEGWRLRSDGERFRANVVVTAVRDSGEALVGFAHVTRDLTERRRTEEQLKNSEDRLKLLIASVSDYAIFVLDPSGRVATWNLGAERLKGYTADEIIGQHFSRFYPPEDVAAGKCEMELEVAAAVGRFEDEGWRVRKDGTLFWANVIITALREDDVLVGFAKVTRDLSERKRHEEERVVLAEAQAARRVAEEKEDYARHLVEDLRIARDRAEEAGRLKDEFLATVGHELRTPLSAILGWGRMLQAGALTPAKATNAVDAIVRNAVAQQQIVDDLLDVSRIVTGQLRIDVDIIDIGQVVTAAVDSIRSSADIKGVGLEVTSNPEAGAIKGDIGRLQQVMWNLLSNALKFTPRGGRIHLQLRRLDSAIEIEVADNGRGISPEFLPHVFERFAQQEGTNSRRVGGLGLGLAIVKHLVELHGGVVEAQSEGVGRGATFIVRLPLASLRSSSPLPTARVIPEGRSEAITYPAELRGLAILVVDDEPDSRHLVQSVLESGGAKVRVAASAADAFEKLREALPDVIVSDVGMPEVDGYEFIRRLRELSREEGGRIPAVALTAYARADDRRKALLAGFQNHASKPMDPQELVFVVANLAGRYA